MSVYSYDREAADSYDRTAADSLKLKLIKSKHGPTYKMEISGMVGKIEVKGEVRQVSIGIDKLTPRFVSQATTLNLADGSGKKVPAGTKRKVEQAILKKLQGIKEGSYDRSSSDRTAKDPDINARKSAYNVAKHLMKDSTAAGGPRVRQAAENYFKLMYRSGTEADRMKAAAHIQGEMKAEAHHAKALVKIMDNYAKVFEKVEKDHEDQIGKQASSYDRTAAAIEVPKELTREMENAVGSMERLLKSKTGKKFESIEGVDKHYVKDGELIINFWGPKKRGTRSPVPQEPAGRYFVYVKMTSEDEVQIETKHMPWKKGGLDLRGGPKAKGKADVKDAVKTVEKLLGQVAGK